MFRYIFARPVQCIGCPVSEEPETLVCCSDACNDTVFSLPSWHGLVETKFPIEIISRRVW